MVPGLHKRKGSDIWQGRFRIPEALWRQRERLKALGVKVIPKAQENSRSTGKLNREEAGDVYQAALVDWNAKMAGWQVLLDTGPQSLSHKQRVAITADHAKAFLAANEDEPFDAPPSAVIPELDDAGDAAWLTMARSLGTEERKTLVADLKEFLRASEGRRTKLAFRLIEKHPGLRSVIGRDLAQGLEEMHGADTDAALAEKGLHVDRVTRRLVNLDMMRFMGAAERGLEARRNDNWEDVPELVKAPAFVAPALPVVPLGGVDGWWRLEALLDHKAKTKNIRPKTVSDNRAYLKKFAKFIHHDDARRVTKDDVRRWRDSLIDGGLQPKTITDKYLSAVRAVLTHGVKEFDLPLNVASGISDGRDSGQEVGSKGWTDAEAVQILRATLGGSTKDLSAQHRRALFWMPWLIAYTGLRAAEVGQFQGRHLLEEDGIPHLLITPIDGSTKSGKAWAVGIHEHLVELGLLDFIRKAGPGPLFYEPYPAGTDLRNLAKKHRGTEVGKRVGKWITEELGLKAPLGHPLHAFRHLHTTRSRGRMDKEARDFMMGSRSGTDAREGYGDWPPSVLDSEINKLPRFDVVDTGWRP